MIVPYTLFLQDCNMLTTPYQIRVFVAVVSVPVDDLDTNDAASVTAFPNTSKLLELSHLDRFLGASVVEVIIVFICPPGIRGGF
mmetsp:Transcript_29826/g.28523  ORF Transcript_29826/g.28523 Transcript_29826/m.28523 type:complete len:84 (-) Transcript_29826:823-1074(-)